MKQKYLTTAAIMRKHTLQNAPPDGIKAAGVIHDRFFTVSAVTNSYREVTNACVTNASEMGLQGMSTAQFVKSQRTTLRTLALANL